MAARLQLALPGDPEGLGGLPDVEEVVGTLMAESTELAPRLEDPPIAPANLGYRSGPSTPMTYTVPGPSKHACVVARLHRIHVPGSFMSEHNSYRSSCQKTVPLVHRELVDTPGAPTMVAGERVLGNREISGPDVVGHRRDRFW